MIEFKGGVAVVTGAASGIGLGMARAFAGEGMRLVLADIEPDAMARAADSLTADGAEVITGCVDVSDAAAVESLAEQAYARFGKVTVVCNNAGVIENNLATWEYSLEDWEWVLGINLMGVVHGIRTFVPRMLAGGEAGHIVNTASFGGLISGTANPIYIVSKHAVVALSENLHNDLTARNTKIGASVLCPGWVRTSIVDSDRNRENAPKLTENVSRTRERFQDGIDTGLEVDAVGDMVVDAISEERFYIHTHPEWMDVVRQRFDAIAEGSRPTMARIPNPKR
jgi:NAD(P)-dependent dehydrogenase (short-subunit alcohol dehydrogenase family)